MSRGVLEVQEGSQEALEELQDLKRKGLKNGTKTKTVFGPILEPKWTPKWNPQNQKSGPKMEPKLELHQVYRNGHGKCKCCKLHVQVQIMSDG